MNDIVLCLDISSMFGLMEDCWMIISASAFNLLEHTTWLQCIKKTCSHTDMEL